MNSKSKEQNTLVFLMTDLEGKPERDCLISYSFGFFTPTCFIFPTEKCLFFLLFVFQIALYLSSGTSIAGTPYSCLCVHFKCVPFLLAQVIRSSLGIVCNPDLL